MIRLFFNPLDSKSVVEYPIAPGTQLIHFLQTHYPTGFDGALRVFVGVEELDLDDLDYEVKETDNITMLVMPSGGVTWVAVGKILISALVGAAIGYVINLIFAPKTPSFGDEGAESIVYSLNPTRNEVRLGQPIASHYGTVSHPPPFATAPYVFYWEGSNDMYVDELLCLGQGEFETITTDDIFIGDTPLSAIEVGTVKYWVFDSVAHNQQMGRIGDYITDAVANTETPWAFYEDVFTSPEIDSFQFEESQNDGYSDADNTIPIPPAAISGSAYAAGIDPVTGMYLLGRIEGVDATLKISGGDTVILTGTTSNNITFVVGSAAPDPLVAGKMTLFQQWATTDTQLVDEIPLNAGAQYQINQVVDGMLGGPFRAQKLGAETNRIDCDIVFPQGLFRVDGSSGKIKTNSVPLQLTFTYQAVDETTGAPIGLPVEQTRQWTSKLRIPIRVTVTSGPLPSAHYECSVRRVNPVSDDSRETDLVTWVGLKGYVTFDRNAEAYGKTTLIAFRMKATNGIAQAARSRIRVVTRRVLAAGESENPIVVIKDIWNNPDYGLGFPLSQLDPAMDELETLWGDVEGPKFNGSYDQKSTGYDAMQSCASMTGSKVVNNGQLTTVVPDRVQQISHAMFSSANIVRDSLEIVYTFDALGDFTGNVVEYRDPLTFDSKQVYAPEQTDNPESFTLFGSTDKDYTQEMANYLWNVKTKRRKLVTFDTELEGLIPSFGQRISISHPMPDWGESGVFVRMIDALTWQVDKDLDWTEDNVIMLRSDVGLPSSPYTVTQGVNPDIVVFGTVPVISDQQGQEPTSYAFGTATNIISDFIVTKISPKGDNIVQVQGQIYDEQVYVDAPWQMGGPCYACDAYSQALIALSPLSYYPFTGGISETDGNTSSGIVYDQVGSTDLTIINPVGSGLNVNAPSLLDGSCEGLTSFFLSDQTGSDSLRTDNPGYPSGFPSGTIAAIGTNGGSTNGIIELTCDPSNRYINITVSGTTVTVEFVYARFDESGNVIGSSGANLTATITDWPIAANNTANVLVTWEADSAGPDAQTTLNIYSDWSTLEYTNTVTGQLSPIQGNADILVLLQNGNNGSNHTIIIDRAVTAAEIATVGQALACNNAPCKYYECDALDTSILASGPLSYTMVNEADTETYCADLTGNDRDTNTSVNIQDGGGTYGDLDVCQGENNNYAVANADTNYRINSPGGTDSNLNDPVWLATWDDMTVHVHNFAFVQQNAHTGSFIAWRPEIQGSSYMELNVNRTGAGSDIRLYLKYNTADENTHLAVTKNEELTPDGGGLITALQAYKNSEVFPFGIHIKRLGQQGDDKWEQPFEWTVYVNYAVAASGTIGPPTSNGPQSYLSDLPPGGGATADDMGDGYLSLRFGDSTSGGASSTVNLQRISLHSGTLSQATLIGWGEAKAQNQSDYVDPNPNCIPS